MANSTVFSVRVELETKEAASKVFKQLGLSLNSGIDVYLRAVAREKAIPFLLTLASQGKSATIPAEAMKEKK